MLRARACQAGRLHCECESEQHYVYRWDELNRLAEARRYDRANLGSWTLATRQRYRYDGANQRTIKQTIAQSGCVTPPTSGTPCERTALYVYPGDFERRGLLRASGTYNANTTLATETQYVVAGARMVFRSTDFSSAEYERDERMVVGVADLIGTTSAAFDVRTGRLVEASTYYPNGARETLVSTPVAATEPSGFTGKEADEEVGVVYFGERYLVPRLGRWASPDPLHVHQVGGGEALNSYHYVGGNLLQARDPLGLDEDREATGLSPDHYAAYQAASRGDALTEQQEALLQDLHASVPRTLPEAFRSAGSQGPDRGLNASDEAYQSERVSASQERARVRATASLPGRIVEAAGAAMSMGGGGLLGGPVAQWGAQMQSDADEFVLQRMPISGMSTAERAVEDEAAEILGTVTHISIESPAAGLGAAESAVAARITGARTLASGDFAGAEAAYETIRSMDDIARIAENTGWSVHRIARVKDHLFFRLHQLDDGVRRFDADPSIANAWHRLQSGTHGAEDLRLLEHELFESRVAGIFGAAYRAAHDAAIRAGRTWGGQP